MNVPVLPTPALRTHSLMITTPFVIVCTFGTVRIGPVAVPNVTFPPSSAVLQ